LRALVTESDLSLWTAIFSVYVWG